MGLCASKDEVVEDTTSEFVQNVLSDIAKAVTGTTEIAILDEVGRLLTHYPEQGAPPPPEVVTLLMELVTASEEYVTGGAGQEGLRAVRIRGRRTTFSMHRLPSSNGSTAYVLYFSKTADAEADWATACMTPSPFRRPAASTAASGQEPQEEAVTALLLRLAPLVEQLPRSGRGGLARGDSVVFDDRV